MGVVILSSVAAGIGIIGTAGIKGLFFGTIAALLGWFIWAFLTYFIGTRLLPEPQTKADYGELLRTIGFSSSPGVLRVLGIIPMLGAILNFIIDLVGYCQCHITPNANTLLVLRRSAICGK
jgi:hypothetical protein